jgi:predicted  nucleic acid-binding Zn-ribbon protein
MTAMKLPARLEDSLKRFASALDHLEAAGERLAIADRVRADLEDELSVMQDDRARLAAELDGALARARALEHANEDVRERVERASASVRAVLEAARAGREG